MPVVGRFPGWAPLDRRSGRQELIEDGSPSRVTLRIRSHPLRELLLLLELAPLQPGEPRAQRARLGDQRGQHGLHRPPTRLVDGVEGDKVSDPDSVFVGKRMKNGWKNSGLPWTYDLDPKLMYLKSKP